MNIPTTLRQGDKIEWDETLSDYPTTDGWTLAFDLRSKDKKPITITATIDDTEYSIDILPAVTRLWQPAIYKWQAYAYKGTPPDFTDKETIETGTLEILPDLTQALQEEDQRTYWEKVRDSLKEAYEAIAHRGYASYSIGDQTWVKENLGVLKDALNDAEGHVLTEQMKERVARGENPGLTIKPRFNRI